MPDFIFAYHGGGRPESAEAGEKMMAAWMAWMSGLGDAMIDPGNPVGISRTIHHDRISDDGGANPLSGYSIVRAETMEAACEMARGCPILDGGAGTVEVAEIREI